MRISNLIVIFLFSLTSVFAQEKNMAGLPVLTVDASKHLGTFKPINGVNGGPRIDLGNYFDNSKYFKAMQPSFVRLHDVPYSAMGAVDVHLIFPIFEADENDPANYQFEKTDLYIKSILDCGSKVIFRLGESIEKTPERLYIQPPSDFEKWSRICCNIIRHYNMGWANGYYWNIKYWEIWNEASTPSGNCWAGTFDEYCELYKQAVTAIKKLDSTLKVGGPALVRNKELNMKTLGRIFLSYCQDNKLPLDFISWHGYANHPDNLMKIIEVGIDVVKEYCFENIETIFDEWNCNRGKTREGFTNITRGAPGAAFTASTLTYMQISELDIACYYSAFGTIFRYGLFDIYGIPEKPIYTFYAWNKLVQCGTQIATTGNKRETGLGITAAINENKKTVAVLLSNFEDGASDILLDIKNIPIKNTIYCSEYLIDQDHSLDFDREQTLNSKDSKLVVKLPKNTVRLLLFTPESIMQEPVYILED